MYFPELHCRKLASGIM